MGLQLLGMSRGEDEYIIPLRCHKISKSYQGLKVRAFFPFQLEYRDNLNRLRLPEQYRGDFN